MNKIKKFIKEHGAALLTVTIMVVSFILALAGEPSDSIKGPGGWMIVRAITLVWSAIMGIGTYSRWKKPTWNNKNMLYWVITWIVFFQAMASFYVNDWCVDGL